MPPLVVYDAQARVLGFYDGRGHVPIFLVALQQLGWSISHDACARSLPGALGEKPRITLAHAMPKGPRR